MVFALSCLTPTRTYLSLAPLPASAMNARTHLKNALAKGEAGVGMWLTYVPLALLALVLIADHPVSLLYSMPGTAHARTIATVPGFNWFLVDAEHGQITDANYSDVRLLVSSVRTDRIGTSTDRLSFLDSSQLCHAITSYGISPIIRIPKAEDWLIKRALDSGAHGLMIPMCHNAVRPPPSPTRTRPLALD